jgi:hypothetical protein
MTAIIARLSGNPDSGAKFGGSITKCKAAVLESDMFIAPDNY